MMPPSGCSPTLPSVSTSEAISLGSMVSVVSLIGCLPQRPDALHTRCDVARLEALIPRSVKLTANQVLWQVSLRPTPRVVIEKIVAVAVVATVAHAAHQTSDRIAQVQRHGIIARVAHGVHRRAVGTTDRVRLGRCGQVQ